MRRRALPLHRLVASSCGAVLVALAGCAGSDPPRAAEPVDASGSRSVIDEDSGGLDYLVSTAEAVVTVTDVERIDGFTSADGLIDNHVYRLSGVEAVWAPAQELPETLEVRESTGFEHRPSLFADCCEGGRTEGLVVFLQSTEGDAEVPEGIDHSVPIIAEEEDGALSFVGREGPGVDLRLGEIAEELGWRGTDLELLTTWMDEVRAGEPGPVSRIAAGPVDPAEEWYALPPTERPLDPELTPPEVLDTLISIEVFVAATATAADEQAIVELRGRQGISFSSLALDGFGGGALLYPEDDLRVVLGTEQSVLDEVRVSAPGPDDAALSIEVDGASVTAGWVDRGEADRLVEREIEQSQADTVPGTTRPR